MEIPTDPGYIEHLVERILEWHLGDRKLIERGHPIEDVRRDGSPARVLASLLADELRKGGYPPSTDDIVEQDFDDYITFAPPDLRACARAYALSMRLDNATDFDFGCHDPLSEQTVRDLKSALHEIASERLQDVADRLHRHLKKFSGGGKPKGAKTPFRAMLVQIVEKFFDPSEASLEEVLSEIKRRARAGSPVSFVDGENCIHLADGKTIQYDSLRKALSEVRGEVRKGRNVRG